MASNASCCHSTARLWQVQRLPGLKVSKRESMKPETTGLQRCRRFSRYRSLGTGIIAITSGSALEHRCTSSKSFDEAPSCLMLQKCFITWFRPYKCEAARQANMLKMADRPVQIFTVPVSLAHPQIFVTEAPGSAMKTFSPYRRTAPLVLAINATTS